MTRSKQKNPNINLYYNYKIGIKNTQIVSRAFEIVPQFVGKTFKVHNGNFYVSVLVTELMIGHKFGEFSFTRKNFSFKKKSK